MNWIEKHWEGLLIGVAAGAAGYYFLVRPHTSGHGGNLSITNGGSIAATSTPTGFVGVTIPTGAKFSDVSYTLPGGPQTPVALTGGNTQSNIAASKGTVAEIGWVDASGAPQVTTITFT